MIAIRVDLMMAEVCHEKMYTTMKTTTPTLAPNRSPATNPQNKADFTASSLVCMVITNQLLLSVGEHLRGEVLTFARKLICKSSESVRDDVVLMGFGHLREAERESTDFVREFHGVAFHLLTS